MSLIENHKGTTPYVERYFRFPTGFTVDQNDETLTVEGLCPGCDGLTSMAIPLRLPLGYKGPFSRNSAPAPMNSQATLYCFCGHQHEGRPAESQEIGCGAYWTVNLP